MADNWGKQFQLFKSFIEAIRRGERAVMYSPEYVAMSQKFYQELIGNKPGKKKELSDIILRKGSGYRWDNRIERR